MTLWTPDAIVAAMQEWARTNGRAPTAREWWGAKNGYHRPSTTVVRKRFGSWNAGITAAGFAPVPSGRDSDTAQLFDAKVDRSPGLGPCGDCHEWTGSVDRLGYGSVTVAQRSQKAHRTAWFLTHGEWPNLHVLHHCDNPSCVNPAHLFLGTHLDNMRDKVAKGRCAGKLTRQHVADIRALRGVDSQRAIADQFGVTPGHVSRIHRGAAWSP